MATNKFKKVKKVKLVKSNKKKIKGDGILKDPYP